MGSIKVKLYIKKEKNTVNTLTTRIKSIKHFQDSTTYNFPIEYQDASHHPKLLEISTIKHACNSMSKENQFRNLTITLPSDTAKLYVDSDGNFIFNEIVLEEAVELSALQDLSNIMEPLCLQTKTKELPLQEIEKKFILEKFNGRNQNAKEWFDEFEKECARYGVIEDTKKIQCLRLFMEDSAKDWFSSTKQVSDMDHWQLWSHSFLQTYADKGWSNSRYAYSYKYIKGYGSLLEYALKKERLLLECEKNMTEISRITHIVIGLPIFIQNHISKDEINTTLELRNQLRKYESFLMNPKQENPSKTSLPDRKMFEKKPCYICAALGKPNRYHPHDVCRNRQRYDSNKKVVHLMESDSNEINIDLDHQKN